jgi:hypothetical protein
MVEIHSHSIQEPAVFSLHAQVFALAFLHQIPQGLPELSTDGEVDKVTTSRKSFNKFHTF